MSGHRAAVHQKVEGNKGVTTVPDVAKASAPVKVYLPKGTKWIDFGPMKPWKADKNSNAHVR